MPLPFSDVRQCFFASGLVRLCEGDAVTEALHSFGIVKAFESIALQVLPNDVLQAFPERQSGAFIAHGAEVGGRGEAMYR